jgi:hypothetical protein
MSLSMKAALKSILKRGNFPGISGRLLADDKWSVDDDILRTTDREFLQTWIDDYADDTIWEKIVAEARVFNDSRNFDKLSLIWYAIRARRLAEDVGSGVDPLQRERQKRHDELLALADAADALTRYWQEAEMRCARLDLFPPFPIPYEQVLLWRTLNVRQAQFLREIAGKAPSPNTRISRQSRNKNRSRLRECTAFMYAMVGHMHEICGKPRYTVVAMMANMAFPEADVSVDDVRLAARRATTRLGRRRKTDPLSPKKSA